MRLHPGFLCPSFAFFAFILYPKFGEVCAALIEYIGTLMRPVQERLSCPALVSILYMVDGALTEQVAQRGQVLLRRASIDDDDSIVPLQQPALQQLR